MTQNDACVHQLKSLQAECQEKGAPDYVLEGLEKTLNILKARDDYCENISSKPSDALTNIIAETKSHPWKQVYEEGKTKWNLTPSMISGNLEGQFLQSIVKMQGAKRVLELGMYTGYGALAFAEAIPEDGVVVTCEIDPYLESFAKDLFSKSPHGKKIQIRIGPAIETLRQLAKENQSFDIIFIDADKTGYKEYYQTVMDNGLLSKGGTIIFDNALFHGTPYVDSRMIPNERVKMLGEGIKAVNDFIAKDDRVHKVMVPIGDGMFIVRRKE